MKIVNSYLKLNGKIRTIEDIGAINELEGLIIYGKMEGITLI